MSNRLEILSLIVIAGENREEYIRLLCTFHATVSRIRIGDELLPDPEDALRPFIVFCGRSRQTILVLGDEI